MKFSVSVKKFVAVAAILSLVICVDIIISLDKYKRIIVGSAMDEVFMTIKHASPARLLRNEEVQRQSLRRNAETLNTLEETEDIWFRRSPLEYAVLKEMHESRKLEGWSRRLATVQQFQFHEDMNSLSICGRKTKTGTPQDLAFLRLFNDQNSTCPGTNSNNLLLIRGHLAWGRTGNNMIEFLHALQLARDNDLTLGIMLKYNTWVLKVITEMWMSVQGPIKGDDGWQAQFEEAFCVKLFRSEDELKGYSNVVDGIAKDLFMYSSDLPLGDYIGNQARHLQTLFRHYNDGKGRMINGKPVQNMCSDLDAVFGKYYEHTLYSVVHQRSLEGEPGIRAMERMNRRSGCDPTGALRMEPDYIKSILAPLGMLRHPIVLISDGQDPSVLERLKADPDISKVLRVVPKQVSWIGGDITLAVMSNVFIGNPASTFSGLIAKSRLAMGFGHNYLFRAKDLRGNWYTVCGDTCVFDKQIMGAMH